MKQIHKALKEGKIRWKRLNDMGDTTEKAQVFAHGIDPEDIHQVWMERRKEDRS